jgi:hypothetical protein
MHIKRRDNRVLLYRSEWVPKGTQGNSHGYSVQRYVAGLDVDLELIPATVLAKLSAAEQSFVTARVIQPAIQRSAELRLAAERRERDPIWRLEQATDLIVEAAQRSEREVVPDSKVNAAKAALQNVRTLSRLQSQPQPPQSGSAAVSIAPLPSTNSKDSLKDALDAIRAARDAVTNGRYGQAPKEGVRSTYPYRKWAEILEAVTGSESKSLMRALQERGFAKTRGK